MWHLRYVEGLTLRIDHPRPSLGSAVHVGIAAGLLMGTPGCTTGTPSSAIEEWAEERRKKANGLASEEEAAALEELATRALGIAQRTLAFIDPGHRWESMLDPRDQHPLVEYEFEAPLKVRGWRGFVGYVDWIAREIDTGFRWLIDFKVRHSFQPVEAEETNLQMATYQKLLALRGIEAGGSIAWQIRDELPKSPKLNKDGSISRAACATDWPTYEAAVKAAGQDPADYAEMREKLEQVEWFRLAKAYRSPREVESVWETVTLPAARDIKKRNRTVIRNMGHMSCNGCEMRDLCLEDLRGGDTDYIRSVKFKTMGEDEVPFSVEIVDDEGAPSVRGEEQSK